MLTENDPISFVATLDPIASRAFYEGKLGLKLVSPSGAKVAWFKDPDGNNLSLTQFSDSNAE
jgi:catechol 2,3-dioxygenase-like lactoylglutathione lyase family enzyme